MPNGLLSWTKGPSEANGTGPVVVKSVARVLAPRIRIVIVILNEGCTGGTEIPGKNYPRKGHPGLTILTGLVEPFERGLLQC